MDPLSSSTNSTPSSFHTHSPSTSRNTPTQSPQNRLQRPRGLRHVSSPTNATDVTTTVTTTTDTAGSSGSSNFSSSSNSSASNSGNDIISYDRRQQPLPPTGTTTACTTPRQQIVNHSPLLSSPSSSFTTNPSSSPYTSNVASAFSSPLLPLLPPPPNLSSACSFSVLPPPSTPILPPQSNYLYLDRIGDNSQSRGGYSPVDRPGGRELRCPGSDGGNTRDMFLRASHQDFCSAAADEESLAEAAGRQQTTVTSVAEHKDAGRSRKDGRRPGRIFPTELDVQVLYDIAFNEDKHGGARTETEGRELETVGKRKSGDGFGGRLWNGCRRKSGGGQKEVEDKGEEGKEDVPPDRSPMAGEATCRSPVSSIGNAIIRDGSSSGCVKSRETGMGEGGETGGRVMRHCRSGGSSNDGIVEITTPHHQHKQQNNIRSHFQKHREDGGGIISAVSRTGVSELSSSITFGNNAVIGNRSGSSGCVGGVGGGGVGGGGRRNGSRGVGSRGSLLRRRQKIYKKFRTSIESWSLRNICLRTCPLWGSLCTYNPSHLALDFNAGLSEGIMSIPMGMSYALLANMPPEYGLYNGMFFPLIYLFLGTAKQVSVGVSAIEALLCAEAVQKIVGWDVPEHVRIDTTIGLSICVGVVQFVMRFLGLGVIAHFIADPVLNGFTTASAFLIGCSQLKHLAGITLPRDLATSNFAAVRTVIYLLSKVDSWNWPSVGIGSLSVILLELVKSINRRWCRKFPLPGSLFVVVLFTILTWGLSLHEESVGLRIVGEIPKGFPSPAVPTFTVPAHTLHSSSSESVLSSAEIANDLDSSAPINPSQAPPPSTSLGESSSPPPSVPAERFLQAVDSPAPLPLPLPYDSHGFSAVAGLGPLSLSSSSSSPDSLLVPARGIFFEMLGESIGLAVMFFVIHVSICKTVAQQKNYEIDPDQELVAEGACNLIGGFFRCFPCASSLSRTSVVLNAGGETVLHNIPYALVVWLTVWVLTFSVYYLPYAVLSGIVLSGVYGMLNFRDAVRLVRLGGSDAVLWVVAFAVTVVFGAMEGIIVSVVLSVLWILKKTARPSTAVLGRLPTTRVYRNVKRFPMATQVPGVRIFRFDASLNFANADFFESKVKQLDLAVIRLLVIDASSINGLDITSIRMLARLSHFFESRRIKLLFANWKGPMRDFLECAGFYETVVPPEHCFLCLHDAVVWAKSTLQHSRLSASQFVAEQWRGSGDDADDDEGRPVRPTEPSARGMRLMVPVGEELEQDRTGRRGDDERKEEGDGDNNDDARIGVVIGNRYNAQSPHGSCCSEADDRITFSTTPGGRRVLGRVGLSNSVVLSPVNRWTKPKSTAAHDE
eukprot:GHVS01016134.1.p1 GENE.GHVS01016134.1~~GHVS01016134.1.p1  ORF type:complete len:1340 (+),score=271.31 GHVS01016134.1:67-4086(+)